jgi:hypothetical protein
VDLNPNVVAIARFRLLLAALRASGVTRLKNAPDFRLNLAAGDSLLHGSRFPATDSHEGVQQTFGGDEQLFRDELKHFYESEDREELHRILGQQYHVVVGNPPYITVKDKALNVAYRNRFDSCHRKYSLAAPFMERFFDLALKGDGKGQEPAGYVGMITANSFMKREFGKILIEEFIPKWDVTHVIDTAGAYIPGHSTPTVILFGKHQPPVASTIRTVMGIKAEPAIPDDPSQGIVWNAIRRQLDQPGSQSEFVSVADTDRTSFNKHPWSIGGGGAAELKEIIEDGSEQIIGEFIEAVGFFGIPNGEEILLAPGSAMARRGVEKQVSKRIVAGDEVRDWVVGDGDWTLFPYLDGETVSLNSYPGLLHWLWPCRTVFGNRTTFSNATYFQSGKPWWEWHQVAVGRLNSAGLIVYANIATHNHVALGSVLLAYNLTAQVITLKSEHASAVYQILCALLNSSTSCFWLKQVCFPKGGSGIGRGIQNEAWEGRFAFDGTKIKQVPIPAEKPQILAVNLDRLAQELKTHTPATILNIPAQHTFAAVETARLNWTETLQRMIALQEELDWECYQLYGLTEAKLVLPPAQVPALKLGERAFEVVMARKLAAGELQTTWFERHGSTPITELPAHWPAPYRELVQRRIALIESDRNIALIEQPEYKRRWNTEPWDEQIERALREWLLNRLEGYFFGGERMAANSDSLSPRRGEGQGEGSSALADRPHLTPALSPPPRGGEGESIARFRHSFVAGQQPALVSTNQLAAVVETDADFLRVAEIYSGGPGFSVSKLVRELVEAESVPFLPFQRYKETGLRKRQDWEHVWELQREEDRIELKIADYRLPIEKEPKREAELKSKIENLKSQMPSIPVPPKYASGDFKKSNWWKLRGKLDVPKERWIAYPSAEREGDQSPVIAWAGWDHLQQAKALAEYYVDASQNRGWESDKLKPLLAGLADLLPWLKQWHNAFNSEIGLGFGDYIAGFLDDEARKQGTTVEALRELAFGNEFRDNRDQLTA